MSFKPEFPITALGNYLNGEFKFAREVSSDVIIKSPADTQDLIGPLRTTHQVIDEAVTGARDAFRAWKNTPLRERMECVKRFQENIVSQKPRLIEILSRETGKPLWESESEYVSILEKFKYSLLHAENALNETVLPNVFSDAIGRVRKSALGVCAVVGPFNFPVRLLNAHVLPALLSGNTVILKPSEKTPFSAQVYVEAFHQSGFPPGVMQLVQGSGEIGRRLVTHEGLHGVFFTGSYEVGTRIKQDTLMQHWKLLVLEMGGKNGAIVFGDAHLPNALHEVLRSAFITCGQRCSSTSRVMVHHSIADEFISQLHAQAKKFRIGHFSESPFMGPIIDSTSLDRSLKFIPIGARDGFEMVMKGKILETAFPGYYVTPTIGVQNNPTVELTKKSVYLQTELFAPHLAVQIFREEDLAVGLLNAVQYGMVASVFTQSEDTFRRVAPEIEAGLINWNRGTVGASAQLPFGGLKKSGNYRPSGAAAFDHCVTATAQLETASPSLPKNQEGLGFLT